MYVLHALGALISRLDTDGLGDALEEEREAILAAVRGYAKRKLATTAEQDARIEGCTDLATLHRWQEEAVVAESAADALA